MQKAFDKLCLFIAANALAAYHDHVECFDIETDASELYKKGGWLSDSLKIFQSYNKFHSDQKEMLLLLLLLRNIKACL
jgi:hypothetical protein